MKNISPIGLQNIKCFLKQFRILIAIWIILYLMFHLVINLIYIPTSSMEPTIKAHSLCISWRLPYLANHFEVNRGDVLVFWSEESGKYLCKRVIGLPGDHISFRGGDVYIDYDILEEDYIAVPYSTFANIDFYVPDGRIFVLGDNRLNSNDSRTMLIPYIKQSSIRSRVICILPLPFYGTS